MQNENCITIVKGNQIVFTIEFDDLEFINNDTLLWSLKHHKNDAEILTSKSISMNQGDNSFTINLDEDAPNLELDCGTYWYDCVVLSGSQRYTIAEGNLVINSIYEEYLINLLHALYRADAWVTQLFRSASLSFENALTKINQVFDNNFFDTADDDGLKVFEAEAGINVPASQSIEDRRSVVKAKWLSDGKATLAQLQKIANSWKNGLVTLFFVNGRIRVVFNSPVGIPSNLNDLKSALENVKPAHLAIEYKFAYWFWQDTKSQGTWGYHKTNGTWNKVKQIEEV